jgi:hypothetical protein
MVLRELRSHIADNMTGSFFTNRFHVQLPVLGSGSENENGSGTAKYRSCQSIIG